MAGAVAQISRYVGRFAPSPTGPLHLGSLTAALASWVDARAHGGEWLLRIEDIDPDREQPGADKLIVESLRTHGLRWDGPITYQSRRSREYDSALDLLRKKQRLYACTCTRKKLRELALKSDKRAYPGICRELAYAEGTSALRLRVSDVEQLCFKDAVCGEVCEVVAETTGDFIVRRRGPLYAYQLAVVADDALQRVTHVVRGADLLDNTARQIVLQRALGYPQPEYLHVPVITQGQKKLSKQTGAPALDNSKALVNLSDAWSFLGQQMPDKTQSSTIDNFLTFAVSHWKRHCIGNISIAVQN